MQCLGIYRTRLGSRLGNECNRRSMARDPLMEPLSIHIRQRLPPQYSISYLERMCKILQRIYGKRPTRWLLCNRSEHLTGKRFQTSGGEHLSLSMMPTIDRAMVHYIYNAVIKSSEILKTNDKDFIDTLREQIANLPPLMIGDDGAIQEWAEKYQRSDPSHRHSSHLHSLFPLDQISFTKNPELISSIEKITGKSNQRPKLGRYRMEYGQHALLQRPHERS